MYLSCLLSHYEETVNHRRTPRKKQLWAIVDISFMKIVNRIRPKINPFGTPKDPGCFGDMFSLILIDWDLISKLLLYKRYQCYDLLVC